MTRQERLDVGEKIFVGAFVGSIVIEVLLTLFALTLIVGHGSSSAVLTTVLLGVVFVGFMLFLANWLYSGDLIAWKTAVGWGGFQIILAVAVIIAFAAASNHPGFADYLGIPNVWLAVIKAVTYVLFVASLALAPPVRDFLGLRRGEHVAEEEVPAAEVPTSGVVVPLTDAQAAAFASLGNWIATAGGVLIVAGILRLGASFYDTNPKNIWPAVPSAVEGAVAVALGALLLFPAQALKLFQSRDLSHLMNALKSLQSLYFKQLILLAVAAVAVVLGIVTAFVK
jgi:hypothetical protein